MVVQRGEIWWADLAEPAGSGPGYRRPILVLQSDAFNRSRLRTVVAVLLSSNVRLVEAPGNVLLEAKSSGLPRDSVANVTQIITLDEHDLDTKVGRVPARALRQVETGVRLVLEL